MTKQHRYDQRRNLGNGKTLELKGLMDLAKSLLCEIETALNNTDKKMPRVYTREKMEQTLHFRSDPRDRNKHDVVDDLDIKFAKVRFHEYLHSLHRIMKRPRKKCIPCKKSQHKQRYQCRSRMVNGKRLNCTLIEPPMERLNSEIGNELHLRRSNNHRRRNANGGHLGGGGGAGGGSGGARRGGVLPHPRWRHRQRGQRRHRNQLVDGTAVAMHRNQRKKNHRALDLLLTTTTTTSTTPEPFSLE